MHCGSKHFLIIISDCFIISKEHFYDGVSHSGFLEMRLRNLRRQLEEGQRRYRKRRKTDRGQTPCLDTEDTTDTRELINLLKRQRPSADNLAAIKSTMQRTFAHRRAWISSTSPTMADIFKEYPRFLDIPELVSAPSMSFGSIRAVVLHLFFLNLYPRQATSTPHPLHKILPIYRH